MLTPPPPFYFDLRSCPCRVDSSGGFSGSGFVKFKTRHEAESAIVLLAGLDFNPNDKPLTAAIAKRDMDVRRQTSAERAQLNPRGGVRDSPARSQPGGVATRDTGLGRRQTRWAEAGTASASGAPTATSAERAQLNPPPGGRYNNARRYTDRADSRQPWAADRGRRAVPETQIYNTLGITRRNDTVLGHVLMRGGSIPRANGRDEAVYDRCVPAGPTTGMYIDSYRPRDDARYAPQKHSPPREYARETGARVDRVFEPTAATSLWAPSLPSSGPSRTARSFSSTRPDSYDSGSGRHESPHRDSWDDRAARDGRNTRDARACSHREHDARGADVHADFKRRRTDDGVPRSAAGRDDFVGVRPVLAASARDGAIDQNSGYGRPHQGSGSPGGAVDTLFVRGLLRETTNDHLAQVFRAFPGFTAVKISQNKPKANYAFVKFEAAADAAVAKDAAHGFVTCKEPYERLNVKVAKRSMQI